MAVPKTVVLIATYQEAENICGIIEQVLHHLPYAHVLVLDDQSPDGTADLVREKFRHVGEVQAITRQGPRGYGLAMREGMEHFLRIGGERLVTLDADFSHDPAVIVGLLEKLPQGGLVIGSRFLDGVRAMNWPVKRLLTSIFGNWYVRLITGLPATDCTSGFRCYTRAALESIRLERILARDYAFLVETLYWLWKAGCTIVEAPIVYRDRHLGESKLRPRIFVESLLRPWSLKLRLSSSSPLKARELSAPKHV